MSAEEYEFEPVRGLPGPLPTGERLLWQGTPGAWALASSALRVPLVAAYFALLALWQFESSWRAGEGPGIALRHVGTPLLLGAAACAVLIAIGWAAARATVYTITDRRIVIRHGIALPMSLNLPFSRIEAAALKMRRDGTGNLAIRVARPQRVSYWLTWPHVRPGHYLQPQPTLRGIHEPRRVAELLAAALGRSAEQLSTATSPANPVPAAPALPAAPVPSRRTASTAATAAA